jgi:NTE family protein
MSEFDMSDTGVVDLVFEGGGMKGIAFIGAYRALDARGYRPGRLVGTSIGSMFATLIAAGYSSIEIQNKIFDPQNGESRLTQHIRPFPPLSSVQIDSSATRSLLKKLDFRPLPDLLEGSFDDALAQVLMKHSPFKGFFAFIENCGVNNPEPYVKWLEDLLAARIAPQSEIPISALTLAEFHKLNGFWLSLIAADVTNPTMLILNHITAPDCPVVQAIRMATAAPLFFPPVVWKSEWGLYRDQELTGDFIVDGALLSNFPIELLLSQHPTVTDMMGKPDENAGVLGLLLDETIAVPGAPPIPAPGREFLLTELPGLTLIGNIIRTVIEARDKRAIELAKDFVVRLPVMGYPLDALHLTPQQLQPLLNAGYNAVIKHLESHPFLSGAESASEAVRSLWDSTAKFTVNVYGDVYTVNQTIGENTGQVTGILREADREP